MKPKTFRAKKLMHGYVSIRDYVVHDCITNLRGILVKYGDKEMLLTPKDLVDKRFQFHTTKFTSKYDNRSYELYDYKFVTKEDEELDLFTKGE
jgi:hypothetical protein